MLNLNTPCKYKTKEHLYMTQNNSSKILVKIKGYVKENWGSPFIISFIVILLCAGISLSVGLIYQADAMVVYAFYVLVIGVALQLVCHLNYKKNLIVEAD